MPTAAEVLGKFAAELDYAAIPAAVDNESFFMELRIIVLYKLIQSRNSHIRHMDISDFAIRRLRDSFDIVLDPVIIKERLFISSRNHRRLMRTGILRLGIEF